MGREPISELVIKSAMSGETYPQVVTRGERPRLWHRKILRSLLDRGSGAPNLIQIYREQVTTTRTRTIRLLGRKGPARINHTLLGYEVQASYKRIQCPDLVTARYLKIFSELGCRTIKLPYDPTVTSKLVPDLETAMTSLGGGVREIFPRNRKLQLYVLRQLYVLIREELKS